MKKTDDFVHELFSDIMGAYRGSGRAKDDLRFEIALQKSAYETILNDLYDAYRTLPMQYAAKYQEQVDKIKGCGYKVLRNSAGVHKIVVL